MRAEQDRASAELRVHGYDGQPLDHKDARLGRLVRRAIENGA